MKQNEEGFVSGWNEGELKNLRLHQIQSAINYYKTAPLDKNEHGIYNFESWFRQIECLCDEAKSKYSKEEIKVVEDLVSLIESTLDILPVFKKVFFNGYGQKKTKDILQKENWNNILNLLRIFEKKVKYFNDLHGFSTRNIDFDDEGL